MAQWGLSLNAMIDGTQQTLVYRYNLDDSVVPTFFEFYRSRYQSQDPPPPVPLTDAEVFKKWTRAVVDEMQRQCRTYEARKTANNAVGGMPPPSPITEG